MGRLTSHLATRIGDDAGRFAGLWRLGSFALAALSNATVHFSIMALLLLALGVAPVLASSVGAVCGTLAAFVFNHRVTFADIEGSWRSRSPRFMSIAASLWFVNGGVLKLALLWGTSVPVGQIAASLVCFSCSWLLNRRFTFTV